MGKKRQNRKANKQKPSSKKIYKGPVDEIDNGPIEKNLKTESKSEPASFNDLPPEMLMKVLKFLDTKDLFVYRLLNRKWNGVATEILQSRTDLESYFWYSENSGNKLKGEKKEEEMSFLKFIEVCHASNNFPYTRFWFDPVDSSTFDNKSLTKFIYDFEERIKCLKLSTSSFNKNTELTLFTKKVRDLLLIQLPKLQEFGLDFHRSECSLLSKIELFPTSDENANSLKESGSKPVQLPHLKVLHFDESGFSKCTSIITNLLLAAINLQKIQTYYEYDRYKMVETFRFLQSLGKLDCLHEATINPIEFLSKIKGKSTAPLDFKLRSLNLNMMPLHDQSLNDEDNLLPDATIFISKLFESCKDSLKELKTDSLGWLDDLKFPRFSKLTKITCPHDGWIDEPFLTDGINPSDIFPVLDSLDLQIPWTAFFPKGDEIPCIPTLKTLQVLPKGVDKRSIAQVSILAPNLKNFEISCQHDPEHDYVSDSLENFPEVGRAIWTHLKKLQTLKLHVFADGPNNAFPAFDSCITGFSTQYCKSLCHLLEADNLWRKCGSRVKIPESEMEAERKHPSILDLKDLESFELQVLYRYWDAEQRPDSTRNGCTWISKQCAFDLMKNTSCKVEKKTEYIEYNEDEYDEDDSTLAD